MTEGADGGQAMKGVALLSNRGRYTVFEYGDTRLMIIAPKPLEHYLKVKEWDKGYLVVEAKYSIDPHAIEEYIDLVPTLEELAIDPDTFCSQIEHVEVARV